MLFVDLLGVRAMSRGRGAQRNLLALDQAMSGIYRNFLREDSQWPTAFFSDTLVIASPATRGEEASALSELVDQAMWLQLALLVEGFFVRGALTLGRIHLHGDLTLGPALVEAYELESKSAVHPRIILSENAAHHLRSSPQAGGALATPYLMRDDDGQTFVSYLGLLIDEPDAADSLLALHQEHVLERLSQHRADRPRWEKYRWVADYHNHMTAGWEALRGQPGPRIESAYTASNFTRLE